MSDVSIDIKELSLSFGATEVLKKMDLAIGKGEFLVLLGPSGCGKSTLLNCIAGLLDATDGQIFINDKNVTWAEPKDRGIGMVFQSYALYPQMTVRGNLSFGLKNQRMAKADIEKRVARAAEILQIGPLLDRKPAALSGGQRQRVAIGRALVRDVDVFLFDEPLSNLDAKLRSELRVELKRLHNRLQNTIVYVTHDQIEALTLADRIAVMRGGIIQQLASPHVIFNKPSNLFVAGFIGSPAMNMLNGTLSGTNFSLGSETVSLVGYDANVGLQDGTCILGVRPEHTKIHQEAGEGRFVATVDIDEPMGSDSLIWLSCQGQTVSVRTGAEEHYKIGSEVYLSFDASRASVFDVKTEQRM